MNHDDDSTLPEEQDRGLTIRAVAIAAGVSVRTVSRVLNRSPKVSGATRDAVQAVIDRMDFSPSLRARALASGRSSLIGLVHHDPNALVLDEVQRGVIAECAVRGYEMIVHPVSDGRDAVIADVARFVRRSRVDGLIVLPPVSELAELPLALRPMRVPSIGMAAVRTPSYPAMIVADERAAAALVAAHFLALGHRRIAIVTGPPSHRSSGERTAGFCDALSAAGVDLSDAMVVTGDYGFDSGVAAGHALLDRSDRPSAIFAGNDVMAAGVLNVATARGIIVPRDLSVAGFDGSLIARILSPTLTTVDRPMRDMARTAAARLIDMIEQPSVTGWDERAPPFSLAVGQSTGSV